MTAEAAPTAVADDPSRYAFGVDVGGTSIKGGLVDIANGRIVVEGGRISTPRPSTPDAVARAVASMVVGARWVGRVGVTFPAVIKDGVALSAANVDRSWMGTDAQKVFTDALGSGPDVVVVNDADAAGIAEARFGAAAGTRGVVIVLTFGTGIGSALLVNGVLVPNTELGHLELDGYDAETRAAASVRDQHGMSYTRWAGRVRRYLRHVERLFTPDLFVVGGGVSRNADKWVPLLELTTPVRSAQFRADAEIVGAALASAEPTR
jgi:polyphosphate glucokinase